MSRMWTSYEVIREKAEELPLLIHTTNSCPDASCMDCYVDAVDPFSPKRIDLDIDVLKLIVNTIQPQKRKRSGNDKLSHNIHVILSGGDALIHPKIPDMITYLKDSGCSIELISSGLPLLEKDSGLWMDLKKLDKKDCIITSVDKYHRFSEKDVSTVLSYMKDKDCRFLLRYSFGDPEPVYPSKRARIRRQPPPPEGGGMTNQLCQKVRFLC